MRTFTLAAAGLALAVIAVPGTAAAAGTPPSPSGTHLCMRAVRVSHRLDDLITLFTATPATHGSPQELRVRAARVKATQPARAALLLQRAQRREGFVPVLRQRRADLGEVLQWCSAHGLGGDA